jgi:hypothetical protein
MYLRHRCCKTKPISGSGLGGWSRGVSPATPAPVASGSARAYRAKQSQFPPDGRDQGRAGRLPRPRGPAAKQSQFASHRPRKGGGVQNKANFCESGGVRGRIAQNKANFPASRRLVGPGIRHRVPATPSMAKAPGVHDYSCGSRRRPEDRARPSPPKSPAGTTDYSPPFQRWVSRAIKTKAPEGRKKATVKPRASFVPGGTLLSLGPIPSDKSLGYGLSPFGLARSFRGSQGRSCTQAPVST